MKAAGILARSEAGLFASRSLAGHLLRGAAALALLVLAIRGQGERPLLSALEGLLALAAMRGCPMCWTIGLFETIAQRRAAQRGSADAGEEVPHQLQHLASTLAVRDVAAARQRR